MRVILVVAAAALLIFCQGTDGPDAEVSSVQYVWDLYTANDSIAGWQEDGTRYKIFDGSILMMQMIDGGAPKYINQGLVAGIFQAMRFDTLYENLVYVMDFGSAAKAKGMLKIMKSEVGGMPLTISGFDTATAAATSSLGGNTTYAWFDRFYIELYLSGYTDRQKSLEDAAAFLGAYKRRILSQGRLKTIAFLQITNVFNNAL